MLGEPAIRRDGATVVPGSPKQRSLLLALLLARGEVVDADRLIDLLWGATPPAHARKGLQVLVARLRRALVGSEHARDGALVPLVWRSGGYALLVGRDQLDADRFASLHEQGRLAASAGDWHRASELLGGALALWSGPALGSCSAERWAAGHAARLEDDRAAALELRAVVDLQLGREDEVLARLDELLRLEPRHERLRSLRMLALARAGRHEEALGSYRALQVMLDEQLGIVPAPWLRELAERIGRSATPPVADTAPTDASVARTAAQVRALLREGARLVTILHERAGGRARLIGELERALGQDHDRVERWEPAAGSEPQALGTGGGGVLVLVDASRHVTPLRERIAATLARSPDVKVVVASAAPLGLYGEHEYDARTAWQVEDPTAQERRVLEHLARFPDGCSVAAAIDLVRSASVDEAMVIDTLEALVARQALRRVVDGAGRVRLVVAQAALGSGAER